MSISSYRFQTFGNIYIVAYRDNSLCHKYICQKLQSFQENATFMKKKLSLKKCLINSL